GARAPRARRGGRVPRPGADPSRPPRRPRTRPPRRPARRASGEARGRSSVLLPEPALQQVAHPAELVLVQALLLDEAREEQLRGAAEETVPHAPERAAGGLLALDEAPVAVRAALRGVRD